MLCVSVMLCGGSLCSWWCIPLFCDAVCAVQFVFPVVYTRHVVVVMLCAVFCFRDAVCCSVPLFLWSVTLCAVLFHFSVICLRHVTLVVLCGALCVSVMLCAAVPLFCHAVCCYTRLCCNLVMLCVTLCVFQVICNAVSLFLCSVTLRAVLLFFKKLHD